MFEYVSAKKQHDKDEIKGKVLTVLLTLVGAVALFAVLFYAAQAG